ncbi:GNAT family N-acetyltransferase [Anaerorhabdus sp.]|uniref:N-acetyltransferase domain-containing protein n=1 Tax=bioreactor metagenome TaxID=1076179 RepID=A0A645BRT7_9ZZZZ|nr:GNAT family N-acetyltransferase [Anaerorhabdus sp.]MEA4874328.1 GNAT family N-acetyltransferase [Anaerorhabdus sp.]
MFWPFHKSRYSDGEIDLVEMYKIKGDELNDYIPSVYYEIYLKENNKRIGKCDLRIGMDHKLYYAGNIGYSVSKPYRGNHYAYKACKILFELAKDKYKMDEIIITCNPDNIASKKTCERLDGEFVELVDVPLGHWLRNQGDYQKCIYRFKL